MLQIIVPLLVAAGHSVGGVPIQWCAVGSADNQGFRN